MNPRDFLLVAEDLLEEARQADWRSAVSRAYYAAFLTAVELFREAGFEVPPDAAGHAYVYRRLNNCGRDEIAEAAQFLWNLRRSRNWADYRLSMRLDLRPAVDAVAEARAFVGALKELVEVPAVLASVVATMRDYERDVLKEVTFRATDSE